MAFDRITTHALLSDYVPTADAPVVLGDVGWTGYESLLALRGEQRRPRMNYLDGAVELMTTSERHERIRFALGRLLETYLLELGVRFCGYGQTTYKCEGERVGFEADECYVLGAPRSDRPDLALEVVHTSGGTHKLDRYRRFGVPEVWIWQRGELRAFALAAGGYREAHTSQLVPRIDLGLLAMFVGRAAAQPARIDSDAILEFRSAIAGKRP